MRIFLLILLMLVLTASYSLSNDLSECGYILKQHHVEHLANNWCNSKERKECLPFHGGEFCDIGFAIARESEILDKKLNDLYKKVIKAANESQKGSIRESQRAWLKFRELDCYAQREMLDGGDLLLRNNALEGCINDYTKERIKQLKEQYCLSCQ